MGLDKNDHHCEFVRYIDINDRKVQVTFFSMNNLHELTGKGLFQSEKFIEEDNNLN